MTWLGLFHTTSWGQYLPANQSKLISHPTTSQGPCRLGLIGKAFIYRGASRTMFSVLTISKSLPSSLCAGWINLSSSFATIASPSCPRRFVILVIGAGTWDKLHSLDAMPFCVLHEPPISMDDRVLIVNPAWHARVTPICLDKFHATAYPLRHHRAHHVRMEPS